MKILQVFDFFSLPHGGGMVNRIYNLSRALAQRGHEVAIYTGDFELDQEYIDSLQGVKVYPFHSWLNSLRYYLTPGMVIEAKRRLKDFDIIHLHCCRSFQNIVIHHYAPKYGVPYVLDAHGSTLRMPEGGKLRWLIKWLFDVTFGYTLLRDASRVIAETEVGINEYKEFSVSKNKIVLIHPPFDTKEFSQLPPPGLFRRKFNIKEKYIILFLGRMHWIKGLDFLVESFYQLTQCRNDVILAMVGPDDGYKPALEKLIKKLNLSGKVLFTGFLMGEERLAAFVDADVLIQTSRYEQGAGVPFEATLCNTPIIVSKHTGAGEDVNKIDAGYLVEFGDKDALREKIEYVLNNPSEAAIKTMKARDYIIANLSTQKKAEEYENLYATCIKESRQMVRRRK